MSKYIKIRETDTEYVLSIPYAQKDRAKSIAGWRWEPNQKCWVYPRNARTYDALIGEFGDDLVSIEITRPVIPHKPNTDEKLISENQNLRDDLTKIHELLQSLSSQSKKSPDSEQQSLRLELVSCKEELTSTRLRFQEMQNELTVSRDELTKAQKEISRLRSLNVTNDFNEQLKEIIKSGTGGDKEFCKFIDKLRIDSSAPIEIAKRLELTLQSTLDVTDRNVSLHDLISQGKDSQILSDEAISLAHLIRRQRNIIAHEKVDIKTNRPRVMLIFLAASLLWPLLPE